MKRSNHEHLRPPTRTHDASQVTVCFTFNHGDPLGECVFLEAGAPRTSNSSVFLPSSQSTSVFDHQSTTKDDWGCAKRNKPTSGYAQTPTSTRDGREVIENLVRFLRGSGGETFAGEQEFQEFLRLLMRQWNSIGFDARRSHFTHLGGKSS